MEKLLTSAEESTTPLRGARKDKEEILGGNQEEVE